MRVAKKIFSSNRRSNCLQNDAFTFTHNGKSENVKTFSFTKTVSLNALEKIESYLDRKPCNEFIKDIFHAIHYFQLLTDSMLLLLS
jgi:hypothetical protein